MVLTAMLSVAGCGGNPYGPTGKITGRLTMEGKPLPAGHSVSFMQMEKGFLLSASQTRTAIRSQIVEQR